MKSIDMMDPFLTFSRDDPDFNESDSLQESRALAERQGVIQDYLQGKTEADHVLDTLNDQGISPDEFVEVVKDNVQYVIDGGVVFESNDAGILLPAGIVI